MKKIYLDYAATSPLDFQVIKAMEKTWACFGNPSSLHLFGQEAKKLLEASRKKISRILNCKPEEIIFLSSATEANNLAIKGLVEAWRLKNPGKKPHLLISPIEHHCVLDTAKHLSKKQAEVSWLKVDRYGLVDIGKIKKLIKPNTLLLSLMYVNNEIGTIEPIKEIAKVLKKINKKRKEPLYFHTDAVQAIQYLDIDVKKLGVDMLSASAHKFYGPKGIGFLYLKKGTPLVKQTDGGGQEFNLRAGTENLPYIVGLAKAMELAEKRKKREKKRLEKLRDYLIKNLKLKIKNCLLTGHPQKRAPHIASFIISGVEGEAMIMHLSDKGIAVSSGSACASGSLKPSHVLLALGFKPQEAHGSLRISLGKETKKEDIDYLIKVLAKVVENLRKMNPLINYPKA